MKSIVLLSGGIDSALLLAMAAENTEPTGLWFDYGQRHVCERYMARKQAEARGVELLEQQIPVLDGSALTKAQAEIPLGRRPDEIAGGGIPTTWVPARNVIFLSYALAWATVREAGVVYFGPTLTDATGYPDCRRRFVQAFETMARAGMPENRQLRVVAPLVTMTKRNVVAQAIDRGVDLAATWSCYAGKWPIPCGECDACVLRQDAFRSLGVEDPYRIAEA